MELYYFRPSPPCRAVLLFLQALNLDPILKEIDTTKGENLTPEYLKVGYSSKADGPLIRTELLQLVKTEDTFKVLRNFQLNPQHTIPLIVDNNFVLSESRAILVYLAEQYAQGSSYYPNDPKARGVINQRLMFDASTLYARFLDVYLPLLSSHEKRELDVCKINKLKEAFEFLEFFMGDSYWMAGDGITIADFSLVATISSAEACGFDLSQYKKITAWLERCRNKMTDYEDTNRRGAEILGNIVKEKLKC